MKWSRSQARVLGLSVIPAHWQTAGVSCMQLKRLPQRGHCLGMPVLTVIVQSFVEETLDGFLRRFLERFLLDLNLADLRVSRDEFVQLGQILFHQPLDILHAPSFGGLFVGEDQSDQFAFALHDDRLADALQVVQFVLDRKSTRLNSSHL